MNAIFKAIMYKLGWLDRPQLNIFLQEKYKEVINRKRRELYEEFETAVFWRNANGDYKQDSPPFNHKSWTL